ncbi:quinolinate synthase NadA [Aquibacillus sp. 3ASR75-11]|uniref:Quinolinate synthase n=1 Tax=Terrihalobacillus insolitus TaxID=2950438 RepID=A0A9X4AME5_9BACI|nr:quinolinate synthase NadA [Terrihalobacillus insolitus]MDC3423428.1 quinolinate synthase NadA [Terrihalobacillus insolitus]
MSLLNSIEKKHTMIPERFRDRSNHELEQFVQHTKYKLGEKLFIPGHHYQKDEVIQFADARGDSLRLAQLCEENQNAEYIVFCGVHFMAETADILTNDAQKVFLPDMRAGCSMADMADIGQTEIAWKKLSDIFDDTILPLTYVNSTAAIKSFVGQHNGATVTSGNAEKMVTWAFEQKERILFLPDQHLGRNTAYKLGIPLDQMAVWDPNLEQLIFNGPLEKVKVILWKGHCSVHENFTVQNVEQIRKQHPDMKIIVHPECRREVVALADDAGSTKHIIDVITNAEKGSAWAIGTEMNLVKRLIKENTEKHIISLNPNMCPCLTMNRIDLPHLAWCLESIMETGTHNQITVPDTEATYAKKALDRMLELV